LVLQSDAYGDARDIEILALPIGRDRTSSLLCPFFIVFCWAIHLKPIGSQEATRSHPHHERDLRVIFLAYH
jgi:hypothetical protein